MASGFQCFGNLFRTFVLVKLFTIVFDPKTSELNMAGDLTLEEVEYLVDSIKKQRYIEEGRKLESEEFPNGRPPVTD